MLYVVVCFALIVSSHGLEIVYERVELLSGTDILESTLRVRKFNRTHPVLNGTLTVKNPVDNTYVVSTDVFHSSLGNQQFNHYPIKLVSEGMCDFIQRLKADYGKFVKDFINFPPKGECPIMPREVHVINHIFVSEGIPPILQKGLWKMVILTRKDNVEKANMEGVMKVYNSFY